MTKNKQDPYPSSILRVGIGEPIIIDNDTDDRWAAIVPLQTGDDLLYEIWLNQKLVASCRSEETARMIAWAHVSVQ